MTSIALNYCPLEDLPPAEQEEALVFVGRHDSRQRIEASAAARMSVVDVPYLPADMAAAVQGCLARKQLGLCIGACLRPEMVE